MQQQVPARGKRELVIALAILAFLAVVMVLLSAHGRAGRQYLPELRVAVLPAPHAAFQQWKSAGVRGRLLFLFDRKLNLEAPEDYAGEINVQGVPLDSYLREDNYLYLAIRNSIVRRVYHVIPDSSWPEVERALAGNRLVRRSGDVYSLVLTTTPVSIMRMRDIPATREQVLISVNGDYWSDGDEKRIVGLLRNGVLISDLIVLSGNVGEEFLAYLQEHDDRLHK